MKTYVKPELYYESFELSQHIAGCSLTMNVKTLGEPASCSASGTIGKEYSESWFITEGVCDIPVEDYCYTNGTTNLATINS